MNGRRKVPRELIDQEKVINSFRLGRRYAAVLCGSRQLADRLISVALERLLKNDPVDAPFHITLYREINIAYMRLPPQDRQGCEDWEFAQDPLWQMIALLPARLRQLFLLYSLQGLLPGDLAKIFSCTEAQVLERLDRARNYLLANGLIAPTVLVIGIDCPERAEIIAQLREMACHVVVPSSYPAALDRAQLDRPGAVICYLPQEREAVLRTSFELHRITSIRQIFVTDRRQDIVENGLPGYCLLAPPPFTRLREVVTQAIGSTPVESIEIGKFDYPPQKVALLLH